MSKIYEALRRAEQERERMALKPSDKPSPPLRVTEEPPPRRTITQDALNPPPADASGNPFVLAEPRNGRLPILLGSGNLGGAAHSTSATNGNSGRHAAGSNGKRNGASNGHIKFQLDDVEDLQPPIATPVEDSFVVPFDLTQIPVHVWTPALHQLPALMERGAAVEQFRSLRSRMHEFRDLNNLKSILVSSGLPQEGKSFVAANLAVSFARHKASRVLLIDGDMRRPSLHRMLGAPAGPGLTEYLSGKATLVEITQRGRFEDKDAVLPHGLASLTFISGGEDGDKAADLSGNRRFDKLIATVSPFFDWIVVDTSPVNLVADGVNLARACDGVLLIARGGRTRFETAQRAMGELKASKILGFVLNAVQDPTVTGGYYGYDNYDSRSPETV